MDVLGAWRAGKAWSALLWLDPVGPRRGSGVRRVLQAKRRHRCQDEPGRHACLWGLVSGLGKGEKVVRVVTSNLDLDGPRPFLRRNSGELVRPRPTDVAKQSAASLRYHCLHAGVRAFCCGNMDAALLAMYMPCRSHRQASRPQTSVSAVPLCLCGMPGMPGRAPMRAETACDQHVAPYRGPLSTLLRWALST